MMNQVIPSNLAHKKNLIKPLILFLTVLLSFTFSSPKVYAHAVLVQASPSANSQLATAPSKIELTFNERLEKELYFIWVFDQSGQRITTDPTQMSQNQKQISIQLPPLKDGNYTVTYHIISEDGHPVEQSYVYSVGVHAQNPGSPIFSNKIGQNDNLVLLVNRGLYYLSLLLLTGWLFWGTLRPFTSEEIKEEYDVWFKYIKHFFLFMMVEMGFIQFMILSDQFSLGEFSSVLTGTTFGLTWIFSIVLSLLSYVILERKKWVDGLWILLLLSLEGMNGHAITLHLPVLAVFLDIFHLITASIWVGGLFILVFFWRNYRDEMEKFLPMFSKFAFLSMIILVGTGLFSTFLFLPEWDYLVATPWGVLLIVKTALVTVVIVIAGIIRWKMKKSSIDLGPWVKWDFSMMLLIVGVVGALTYQSPSPANKPLFWHEMGEGMMVTTQITPNAPGTNQFTVDVLLEKNEVQLKRIELFLKNRDKDLAPIQIPLESKSIGESQEDSGFQYDRFVSIGPYLPFSGDWTVEVRILDSNDDENVYTKDFTVY